MLFSCFVVLSRETGKWLGQVVMLSSLNPPSRGFIRISNWWQGLFQMNSLNPNWVLEVIVNNTHEPASAIGRMRIMTKKNGSVLSFLFFHEKLEKRVVYVCFFYKFYDIWISKRSIIWTHLKCLETDDDVTL